jgi:hypothetical protein
MLILAEHNVFLKRIKSIAIVTVDHGASDMSQRAKDLHLMKCTVFSGDCVGGESDWDSIFTTTGVIAHLGNDQSVAATPSLEALRQKRVLFATDRCDRVDTVFNPFARLQGPRTGAVGT